MRVLIVEDDSEINRFVQKGLKAESFAVDVKENGKSGLQAAKVNDYDLIILDFYLPDMKGLEIAQQIRERKKTVPIVVLTAESKIETKVEMLKYCDDYVNKPFSLQELVARIRAILRRGNNIVSETLNVADLQMNVNSHKVTRGGKEITLRNKEFALLEYLMRNTGNVVSRGMILEKVWDMNADPFTNTIDVHIRLLRSKLENSHRRKLIHTVPTRGYKIEE